MYNESPTIEFTKHCLETRNGTPRDLGLPKRYIHDIINIALKNGLTQFRNKGKVSLKIGGYKEKPSTKNYSIILNFKNNKISIITILHTYFYNFDVFPNIRNSINLHRIYNLPNDARKVYNEENFTITKTSQEFLKNLRNKRRIRKYSKSYKPEKKKEVKEVSQSEINEFLQSQKLTKRI